MEKYFYDVLKSVNEDNGCIPFSISTCNLSKDEIYGILIELDKSGLVTLTKRRVGITIKGRLYLRNLNPNLKKEIQSKRIANRYKNIIDLIKKISLAEWAALATIVATIIAIWIYVLQPLLS
jgi:predicted transcriptional regulator